MTESNGTVTGISMSAQQNAHWPSDYIASADHNRMFSFCIDMEMEKQKHYSMWGSRNKTFHALNHFSDIDRMKPIYVFVRIDGFDHLFFGNMFGQWKLNENSVNIRITVQLFDFFKDTISGNIFFKTDKG